MNTFSCDRPRAHFSLCSQLALSMLALKFFTVFFGGWERKWMLFLSVMISLRWQKPTSPVWLGVVLIFSHWVLHFGVCISWQMPNSFKLQHLHLYSVGNDRTHLLGVIVMIKWDNIGTCWAQCMERAQIWGMRAGYQPLTLFLLTVIVLWVPFSVGYRL